MLYHDSPNCYVDLRCSQCGQDDMLGCAIRPGVPLPQRGGTQDLDIVYVGMWIQQVDFAKCGVTS